MRFRIIGLVAIVTLLLMMAFNLFETDYDMNSFSGWKIPCTPVSDRVKLELITRLRKLGNNLLELEKDFKPSSHYFYSLTYQFNQVNNILKTLSQETIKRPKLMQPEQKAVSKKQEVCPEIFAGDDLGYGKPYYRLGFARVKCNDFVAISSLITLLMYVPHEFRKPAMSNLEMMTTIANDYPQVTVIIASENALSEDVVQQISSLNISFKNEIIQGDKRNMWAKLLNQVRTPYVLIAPHIAHFDDDIDLYRLVRVLSYHDDVAVAGGSFRNLTGHWNLGCQQVTFNYWIAKYTDGYYHSFNECVVCDYLSGPFAAKTQILKSLTFDSSLSEGVFHDVFWRLKHVKTHENLAVVCPDVMFNINTSSIPNEALINFTSKHQIKKIVNTDGSIRWYGCRRGLSYTNKTECSWSDGIGVPPCDLWNLADIVKFVMQLCEESMICEYVAGDIVGAVHFGGTHAWSNDAEIYFLTKDFGTFENLRLKFESVGFSFHKDQKGFVISTRNWKVILKKFEMLGKHKVPTKILMSGVWVTVPHNPGMFARGRYLKQGFSKARTYRKYFSSDISKKCPDPSHSACLDQYPVNGNAHLNLIFN